MFAWAGRRLGLAQVCDIGCGPTSAGRFFAAPALARFLAVWPKPLQLLQLPHTVLFLVTPVAPSPGPEKYPAASALRHLRLPITEPIHTLLQLAAFAAPALATCMWPKPLELLPFAANLISIRSMPQDSLSAR